MYVRMYACSDGFWGECGVLGFSSVTCVAEVAEYSGSRVRMVEGVTAEAPPQQHVILDQDLPLHEVL